MEFYPPDYFSVIQNEAKKRWDQLENDPGLAGPWKQLFRQVQSPRHVLSELLQNADDAGATWAVARVDDGAFHFIHNGDDFDERSFRSLCNFGHSEKRHLHTIGFRGLGFKSTFSMGSRVEVHTPTIAFAFEKKRFTEPLWLDDSLQADSTKIKINLDGEEKSKWLQQNITTWQASTIPLLFFNNILGVELQGRKVFKEVIANGPIPNSEWVRLNGNESQQILRIWSEEQEFPAEALFEVREERGSDEISLPACKVEVLLGVSMPQRIYLVLPSEVQVELPFSFNAPFIADPARTGIKDPITSPTNRWLLARVGELAAKAMQQWLNNSDLSVEQRTQAYDLLCEPARTAISLGGNCREIVVDAFGKALTGSSILLTEEGTLVNARQCLDLPIRYLETWNSEQLLSLFASYQTSLLSRHITERVRKILANWKWLNAANHSVLMARLCKEPYPPIPDFDRLCRFWVAIQKNEVGFMWNKKDLAIVPVKSAKTLLPSKETVSISAKERQFTDDEWNFISQHIFVVDPEWIEFLNNKSNNPVAKELSVSLGLDRGLGVDTIVRRAAEHIFAQTDPGTNGIRLAHIAARMNVEVPEFFKYLCQDGTWRVVSEGLLTEDTTSLESVLPENRRQQFTIHSKYDPGIAFRNEWKSWVISPKSKLRKFVLPQPTKKMFQYRTTFENFLQKRGEEAPHTYPRKTGQYYLSEFDFDDELWNYWEKTAKIEPHIWSNLTHLISSDWDALWFERCRATGFQTGGARDQIVGYPCTSSWLARLRSLQCLPDTYGRLQYPAVLLRMTAQNAHLQKIERFVHPDYDRPEYQEFLNQLGVRDRPDNPDVVMARLRTLSALDEPPLNELFNIYQALDSVLLNGSNAKDRDVQDVFQKETLIWGDDKSWHTSKTIFQRNDDRIPGMVTIAGLFASIGLWARVGVPLQPDLKDALAWLASLPKGKILRPEERGRIEAVLRRAPDSVWQQVGGWLTLDGAWGEINKLRWRTILASGGTGLFSWVRHQTADLSFLDDFSQNLSIFENLPILETQLKAQINNIHSSAKLKALPEWIEMMASLLMRIKAEYSGERELDTGNDYASTREIAQRLLNTKWQEVDLLEIAPILEGEPAGGSQQPLVYWFDKILYVRESGPNSQREFVKVFTDVFQNPNLRATIRDCFERKPEWIEKYFETYFTLEVLETKPIQSVNTTEDHSTVDGITESEQKDSSRPGFTSDDSDGQSVPAPGEMNDSLPGSLAENGSNQTDTTSLPNDSPDLISDTEAAGEAEKEPERKERKSAEERVADLFGQMGYVWNETGSQFTGQRGFIKKDKAPFHWIEYDRSGFQKSRFWVSSKSLEKGVEIPSEVWELFKGSAKSTWLILSDEDEHLRPFSYDELHGWIQSGEANLHLAMYRLVKNISN